MRHSLVNLQSVRRAGAALGARLGGALLAALTVVLLTSTAARLVSECRHAVYLEYVPTNGSFQTYNPERRLLDGQVIGRDFQAYLGLGPTLSLYAAARPIGRTLADVLLASNLLNAGFSLAALLFLGRASGLPWFGAALAAAAVLALGFLPTNCWAGRQTGLELVAWRENLYSPGNSNLGLRAFGPFVVGLLSLAVSRRWLEADADGWRRMAVFGPLAGLGLVWSNDYGLPTWAACCLVWGTLAPPALAPLRRARLIVGMAGVGLLVGAALAAIATRGHLISWWRYNYLGVAADQFWYFNGDKACRLADLPLGRDALVGLVAIVHFSLRTWRGQSGRGERLLLFVLLASWLAGLVSSSGSIDLRYFLPLQRVLLFAVPRMILQAWGAAAFPAGVKRAGGAAALVCGVVSLYAGQVPVLRSSKPAPAAPADRLSVPELGGSLERRYDAVVAIGREWRDRAGGPPRVFSTYSSGLETIAGVFQPTGHDYIIHALGPHERERYLAALVEGEPDSIVTLRETYSRELGWGDWEGWVRRVNWDAFREILTRYRPVERTFYCVIWEKRSERRKLPAFTLPVKVAQVRESEIELTVALPLAGKDARTQIVEVEIDVDARWLPNRWSTGSLRHLLRVTVDRPFASLGLMREFGLPLGRGPVRFPVEVEPGNEAHVRLRLLPEVSSRLRINGCAARPVIAKAEIDDFRPDRLRPTSLNDHRWADGIWSSRDRAGFTITDATELRHLAPGDRLHFARSGWRVVTGISDDRVWVDGPALDPSGDGYPRRIELAPRPIPWGLPGWAL